MLSDLDKEKGKKKEEKGQECRECQETKNGVEIIKRNKKKGKFGERLTVITEQEDRA